MYLSRRSLSLHALASTDEMRPSLTSVYVELDGTAVATDGRHLMVCSPAPQDTDGQPSELHPGQAPGEAVLLPAADVKRILKGMPRTHVADLTGAAITRNGEAGYVKVTHAADRRSFEPVTHSVKVASEHFPNWRNVTPDPKRAAYRVRVDARRLLELCKVFADNADRNDAALVVLDVAAPENSQTHSHKPITLTSEEPHASAHNGQTLTAVLMPIVPPAAK